MQGEIVLSCLSLILRPVTLSDVTNRYVSWMNDPEVNRFMETRFRTQNQRAIEDYVKRILRNPDIYFFAMIDPASENHIGNIKLTVNTTHKRGEISLFIGERELWGAGLATQAISMIRDFGTAQLGLHKLTAGCYSNNHSSARAFEKAGFAREAVLKQEYVYEDRWVDRYCYAYIVSQ